MIIRHNSAIFLLLLLVTLLSLASTRARTTDQSRRIYVSRSKTIERDTNVLKGRVKKPSYISHSSNDLVCRPFGECEPCPSDELDQPFCLPFGNRRLLHCVLSQDENTNSPSSDGSGGGGSQSGEVPAWEACGKVIKKERRDFWEFVTANILFLVIALTILWARTSALATEQYRQLAARIGIPGSTWRT